ncbi:hypothetical protein AVEN_153227-1, partial [Araneus ventricosus]
KYVRKKSYVLPVVWRNQKACGHLLFWEKPESVRTFVILEKPESLRTSNSLEDQKACGAATAEYCPETCAATADCLGTEKRHYFGKRDATTLERETPLLMGKQRRHCCLNKNCGGKASKNCVCAWRVIDICKKIKNSPNYEEEFAKGQLDVIVQERENEIAQAELAKKERKAELDRKERETERIYELEALKIASAAETVSLNSTRSEGNRNRREIKHLMQKFDSQNNDISLYLTLFERQARAAGIEEEEWVSQLISLLPLDLAQIIIKEPEEQMREYTNVKKVY